MLAYQELRAIAGDGDVLLVEGRGWVSAFIRALTGQSISHVAILLWFGQHLFVAEMKEFHGYRLRPASLWIADALSAGTVYYGAAPRPVSVAVGAVPRVALSYRNNRYSYASLFSVWLAQILRRKVPGGLVCSTFVQRVWETCGYHFDQTADPGDYLRMCEFVLPMADAGND